MQVAGDERRAVAGDGAEAGTRTRREAGGRGEAGGWPAPIQLTARGGIVGLFVACFLTLLLADLTGWRAVADLAFVVGGGAAAWYTKRGSMLPLAVSPPIIFLAACVCAELLTRSGTLTTAIGIFVILGTSTPWLFIGTALILGVSLSRGLAGEIADHVADLRGVIRRR
jgi:hypothetical protein